MDSSCHASQLRWPEPTQNPANSLHVEACKTTVHQAEPMQESLNSNDSSSPCREGSLSGPRGSGAADKDVHKLQQSLPQASWQPPSIGHGL